MEGSNIIQCLVGAATITGVWFAEIAKNKRERYQAICSIHLDQLKDEVYRPLRNRLLYIYLPIIEMKVSNIVAKLQPESTPEGIYVQGYMGGRIQLVVPTIYDLLADSPIDIRCLQFNVDDSMYEDAKKNHERKLIFEWEDFVRKVDEYNDTCLTYAGYYERQLIGRIRLPMWSHSSPYPGFNATWLAAHIWQKQLGIKCPPIKLLHQSSRSVLMNDDEIIAEGDPDDIMSCCRTVKRIISERETIEQARRLSKSLGLKEQACHLDTLLNESLHTQKLRGKCLYLK